MKVIFNFWEKTLHPVFLHLLSNRSGSRRKPALNKAAARYCQALLRKLPHLSKTIISEKSRFRSESYAPSIVLSRKAKPAFANSTAVGNPKEGNFLPDKMALAIRT